MQATAHVKRPLGKKMRRGTRNRLFVALLLAVAYFATPSEAAATLAQHQQEVESVVRGVESRRNMLSERSVHTALLPDQSLRIASSSSRTYTGRQRTHTNWISSSCGVATAHHQLWQAVSSQWATPPTPFTSRAADYYIYALRHIII